MTEVAQIVKELGHLALAITLAGSYVSETPRLSSDIGRYLPEYRERRKELLRPRAKRHIHQYGESGVSWTTNCINKSWIVVGILLVSVVQKGRTLTCFCRHQYLNFYNDRKTYSFLERWSP